MKKLQKPTVLREGFWYSEQEPELPMPQPYLDEWPDKAEFLRRLTDVEGLARKEHYRGWSDCRLCEQKNGSVEYQLGPWKWPAGLQHYIEVHNVRPSLAFEDFIFNGGNHVERH